MKIDYDHQQIEERWQETWEETGLYRSRVDWSKPKHYALTMLPYPSGDLHIGHWYAMTPSDARARMMRMKGYNVLFPMGFDSFGLPAENAAVQRNIHPAKWTSSNIDRMRRQLRSMGAMFDWEREAVTSDPSYYRWTEWFFKRFFEAGIAYRGQAVVNWSPTLQTVLANEQVVDGKDERTGQPVVQRTMEQWFFAITRFADELLSFDGIDWPEPIRVMQTNWIGRSEGANVTFTSPAGPIEIFTTRPDTLWGATFMVLAPEHPLVDGLTTDSRQAAVEAYREQTASRSELERMEESREKSGVFTGGYATNPVNDERIPVWIADYVLMTYGSGAIMAVPAHDQRDLEFARHFDLPVVPVIHPAGQSRLDGKTMPEAYVGPGVMVDSPPIDAIDTTMAKGRANPSVAATIDWLEEKGIGAEAVNYRLRDWLISRQRYWGSPIPMLYTEDGRIVAVEDEQLPVLLPEEVEFVPTGRSPLLDDESFVSAFDAEGQPARRETDTMDTFMCSSWYQYRYLSPDYATAPFDPEEAAYWLPVDVYTGGAEHAVLHLLYTRFFTKAMADLGMFDDTLAVMEARGRPMEELGREPMKMVRNQGQILGEERRGDRIVVTGTREGNAVKATAIRVDPEAETGDGIVVGELVDRSDGVLTVGAGETPTVVLADDAEISIPGIPGANDVNQLRAHLDVQRMSKSRGNVVSPDELVETYGADTVRAYMMFAFDWEKGGPWDSRGILGARRFVEDVWKLGLAEYEASAPSREATASLRRLVHKTIQKVEEDMLDLKWNTAVAALMTLRNAMQAAVREGSVESDAWEESVEVILKLLAPIAPHVTEELWTRRGGEASIHLQPWPTADPAMARDETVTMVIQVNGKVRDRIDVPADISEEAAVDRALAADRIQSWLEGAQVRRVVARPPKLVNVVVD